MEISTGLNIGDHCYVVSVGYRELCPICDGTRRVEIRGEELNCPKCHGNGLVGVDDITHITMPNPYEVIKIDVVVNKGCCTAPSVKYKVGSLKCASESINVIEDYVFKSREAAELFCKTKNSKHLDKV